MTVAVFSLAEALTRVSEQSPASVEFSSDKAALLLYAPFPIDRQEPHERDEVYVVVRGNARLVGGTSELTVAAGDAIFVSKGELHKFLEPTEDFAVWAFFYSSL